MQPGVSACREAGQQHLEPTRKGRQAVDRRMLGCLPPLTVATHSVKAKGVAAGPAAARVAA